MENIGFLLKNARENKNFTQKQVMELTGINRKSLSGYENNVAEPDLSTFSTLLNLYEVSSIVENKTEAISLPLLLQKFNSDIHIYFVMPTTHYLTAYHTFSIL